MKLSSVVLCLASFLLAGTVWQIYRDLSKPNMFRMDNARREFAKTMGLEWSSIVCDDSGPPYSCSTVLAGRAVKFSCRERLSECEWTGF